MRASVVALVVVIAALPAQAAAPTLAPIGARATRVCDTLAVEVVADDVDGDDLTLDVSPLPTGGRIVRDGHGRFVFLWAPLPGDEGTRRLTFEVADGTAITSEPITVTIGDAPDEGVDIEVTQAFDPNLGTTFAEAVGIANASPGRDTIRFSPGLDGSLIETTNPPVVTESVIIDGSDVPAAALTGAAGTGLVFTDSCNVVRDVALQSFITEMMTFQAGGNRVERVVARADTLAAVRFDGAHGSVVDDLDAGVTVHAVVVAGAHGVTLRNSILTSPDVALVVSGAAGTVVDDVRLSSALGGVQIGGGASCFATTMTDLTLETFGTAVSSTCAFTRLTNSTIAFNNRSDTGVLLAVDPVGSEIKGNRIAFVSPSSAISLDMNRQHGPDVVVDGNVLEGNARGIDVVNAVAGGVVRVTGNRIGVDEDGGVSVFGGANSAAITVTGSVGVVVGGVGADGNHIGSAAGGIVVDGGRDVQIGGNTAVVLFGGLGIDLLPQGVTDNDDGDVDVGSNDLQNFPVIQSAVATDDELVARGVLDSRPNTTFLIELFRAGDVCDTNGHGEMAEVLGAIPARTDATGKATWSLTVAHDDLAGKALVATAIGPGGTSEPSACAVVVGAAVLDVVEGVGVADGVVSVGGAVLVVDEGVGVDDVVGNTVGLLLSLTEGIGVSDDDEAEATTPPTETPPSSKPPSSSCGGCGGGDGAAAGLVFALALRRRRRR